MLHRFLGFAKLHSGFTQVDSRPEENDKTKDNRGDRKGISTKIAQLNSIDRKTLREGFCCWFLCGFIHETVGGALEMMRRRAERARGFEGSYSLPVIPL